MNRRLISLLSLFLCGLLLTACAENRNSTAQLPAEAETPAAGESTPSGTETPTAGESASANPEIPPTEESSPAVPEQNSESLSEDALAEYADWFLRIEYNGLLRFPYSNGADSTQIAPYLDLLFYDMGETDISDEEYALLEKAGMFLEIDEFRLSRAFITEYLSSALAMPRSQTELMLAEPENLLGIYLPETDAWYMCHGDTAWMSYTFDRGEYFPDSETVKLYYSNPFLTVLLPDGELDFLTDQPMVVTLSVEGGERYVLANEILS